MDELKHPDAEVSDAVFAALAAGNKVQAIKLLREETGLGLREAKDIVDALAGHQDTPADPGVTIEEHGGAAAMIRLIVAAVVIVLLFRFFFAG